MMKLQQFNVMTGYVMTATTVNVMASYVVTAISVGYVVPAISVNVMTGNVVTASSVNVMMGYLVTAISVNVVTGTLVIIVTTGPDEYVILLLSKEKKIRFAQLIIRYIKNCSFVIRRENLLLLFAKSLNLTLKL